MSLILIAILLLINCHIEYFPVNINPKDKHSDYYLTIATNNIHSQGEYLDKFRDNPESLYMIFKDTDADILFIQEFDSGRCARLTELLAKRGYELYNRSHPQSFGENVIYSKFPLKDIKFEQDGLHMYATFKFHSRDISIINCHLTSNNIGEKIITNDSKTDWIKRMPEYIESIKTSSLRREQECKSIRHKIDSYLKKNRYLIVAGDMNDLCGSKCIKTIQGRGDDPLYDAWWKSGTGVGNTYHGYGWLHYRLDHIFYSKGFQAIESKVIKQPFSDHDILETRLKLSINKYDK